MSSKTKPATGKRHANKPAPVQTAKKEPVNKDISVVTLASTPAPEEVYPEGIENEMDLAQVTAQMETLKGEIEDQQAKLRVKTEWMCRLYRRFQSIQDVFMTGIGLSEIIVPEDGRTKYNPVKNLKISARRAYIWAKEQGRNASDAFIKVRQSTLKSAQKKYADHADVRDFLQHGKLPVEVEAYIIKWRDEYDTIRTERDKTTGKAATSKAS